MLYASFPCACAIYAMFGCLNLGYVCHAMCYCSPFVALSFFLVFWPIGSDPIWTLWYFSSSIHLSPYQRVWIVPISHVYACLLLCFMLVLASLVLGFAIFNALSRFVVVWLHPTPMRPCLGVTIWDASPDAESICAYPSLFLLHAKLSLPCLIVPPIGLYASLHPCLHAHA